MVSLLCSPISSVSPAVAETQTAPDDAWERRAGKEKVEFKQPLRGKVDADVRAEANHKAIGGLRDARKSLLKLPQTAAFGENLGTEILSLLSANQLESDEARCPKKSWINATCELKGTKTKGLKPPPAAVDAVR